MCCCRYCIAQRWHALWWLGWRHSFFGVSAHDEDLFIVTEFCPGSLQAWLEVPENRNNLDAVRQIALDIARGMRYLHGRGVVVRASVVCVGVVRDGCTAHSQDGGVNNGSIAT